jgi:hypothetical protein
MSTVTVFGRCKGYNFGKAEFSDCDGDVTVNTGYSYTE